MEKVGRKTQITLMGIAFVRFLGPHIHRSFGAHLHAVVADIASAILDVDLDKKAVEDMLKEPSPKKRANNRSFSG